MKKLINSATIGGLLPLLYVGAAYAQDFNVTRPEKLVTVDNLGQVVSAVAGVMIIVAAIAAFLFLIIGGIQWITSGGDKAGMEAARNRITAAIVGLIIVASAWALMYLLGQFIGFNILEGVTNIPTINNPNR